MIYNSMLYKKFHLSYCKDGLQLKNELYFWKKITQWKKIGLFFFNVVFETLSLGFISIHMKRKSMAKYAEIIPKLLTKKQRVRKTIGFLKKYWKLFSFESYDLQKQKSLLYKTMYKNRLNFESWK